MLGRVLVDVASSDPALLSCCLNSVSRQERPAYHTPTRRPKHHSVKLQAWIARHQSVTTPTELRSPQSDSLASSVTEDRLGAYWGCDGR